MTHKDAAKGWKKTWSRTGWWKETDTKWNKWSCTHIVLGDGKVEEYWQHVAGCELSTDSLQDTEEEVFPYKDKSGDQFVNCLRTLPTCGGRRRLQLVNTWKRTEWLKDSDTKYNKWFCSHILIGDGKVEEYWKLLGTCSWEKTPNKEPSTDTLKDMEEDVVFPYTSGYDDDESDGQHTHGTRTTFKAQLAPKKRMRE